MGNFECNGIEDLLFNSSFRQWVLSAVSTEPVFWDSWLAANPQHTQVVQHARAIILALEANFGHLSTEAIDREIERIVSRIDDNNLINTITEEGYSRPHRSFIRRLRWPAAAILLCAMAGIYFFFRRQAPAVQSIASYQAFVADTKQAAVEKHNTGRVVMRFSLPDGSQVSLEPGSSISYAPWGEAQQRSVFLSGEAFFIIEKDPTRSFLVYTNSILTKVLGTSFRIRAYANDKRAVITVKTGKVSVSRIGNSAKEEPKTSRTGAIVVTPNQELTYTRENNELNKTITETPEIVAAPPGNAFDFDATPVRQVFKIMQDTYNIPVVYDEEIMSGCSLSARIGDASFYGKLDLICKAINASYEMIDGQIVIVSKGCR